MLDDSENVDNWTLFTAARDEGYLGTYTDFEGIAAAGEVSDLFAYLGEVGAVDVVTEDHDLALSMNRAMDDGLYEEYEAGGFFD